MDISTSWALWGFFGALVYAAAVATKELWGDNPAQGRGKIKTLAEFCIAVIFGPIAAEGFGPSLASLGWLKGVDPKAIALTIGLSANYVWPIAVKAIGGVVAKRIERGT